MYRVYIVEDDELMLKKIVEAVPWMDNGFEVVGYSDSPTTAIEEIPALSPHVVFSDLRMPVMNGNQMITVLREQNVQCEFVMLSAFGTFEDCKAFFLQEGFDYILKPIQLPEVQLVLERLSAKLTAKLPPVTTEPDNLSPAFAELTSYITEHIREKYTLDSLGKQFGLNPNYICNLFAKRHNTTLTRFLTQLRMKEAVRLMKQSGAAFKEIAVNCGYVDYYYFCKVFKEFYGMTPTQYRTENFGNA